ncbi:MAG: sulfatase-like hydrolase/transferase [Burkholderiales bacterium]|nr:sulfatase-like hydrolase/transferase [Burkholderiales bacterium]
MTKAKNTGRIAVAIALGLGLAGNVGAQGAGLDRAVLPIPAPTHPPIETLDVRNAKAPPRFEVKAPKDAPNVVIVLIDDMGFAHPSTFGGAIAMPTLDRLARTGVRYSNFHVTALCSPTRAALLTGRNHHTSNTGAVQDVATAFPGNTGVRPASVAPLAEMLRLNGYNTAAFGKWHLTPLWETSISGPYTTWPTGSGFEKFYGFLGGETNQWAPLLYDGVARVELPGDPNYHFMTDMTNQAIAWVRFQQTMTPDRPFFMYFAPGSTHAPHHVPREWADKYKGKFDEGWDKYREQALARQIKLGVVPPGTKLAPKPAGIKDWDTLTADEKRLFARQMEVFAGFAEQTDYEIGRLVKTLEDLGVMGNTLFVYIAGDNGASAEGGFTGTVNEMTYFNGVQDTVANQLKSLDKWGGPETYPHFAAGWAVAGNAPFAWTKQVGSDYGGSTNGLVVHWPKRIKAKGEVRAQFTHVTDIAPTVLEAAKLPFPASVNGTAQKPFAGVSLAFTFDDAAAKERHTTQYFEIAGNRGIYHQGWFARTIHRAPWEQRPRAPLDRGYLGALRHAQRLQPRDRPGGEASGEAEGAAGALHEGGGEVRRPADRRSQHRADGSGPRRAPGPDGRAHHAHALSGHDRHDGEHVPQPEGALQDHHRGNRGPAGRGQRRHPRARRTLRRLEPLHEGRQARLRVQLGRPRALHGGRRRAGPGRQGDHQARFRLRRR